MPVFASGAAESVMGFAFAAHAVFDGFLFDMLAVEPECQGGFQTGDEAAAAHAEIWFDFSTGVFANADYVSSQDRYHLCLSAFPQLNRRDFVVAVIDSLTAPIIGQTLVAPTQIGSLVIAMPALHLRKTSTERS